MTSRKSLGISNDGQYFRPSTVEIGQELVDGRPEGGDAIEQVIVRNFAAYSVRLVRTQALQFVPRVSNVGDIRAPVRSEGTPACSGRVRQRPPRSGSTCGCGSGGHAPPPGDRPAADAPARGEPCLVASPPDGWLLSLAALRARSLSTAGHEDHFQGTKGVSNAALRSAQSLPTSTNRSFTGRSLRFVT